MKRLIAATSHWPESLTYVNFEEGDQLINGFLQALKELNLTEGTDARGGHGTDYFYQMDRDGDEYEIGSIDPDEEQQILEELYYESDSEEDYVKSVKLWLERYLDL